MLGYLHISSHDFPPLLRKSGGKVVGNSEVKMAQPKWISSSKFSGVRWYKHETRKHGIRFDRCFGVRYSVHKKRYEAVLGWETEGWSEEKAYLKRQEFIGNLKQAEGPATPREESIRKHEAAEERRRRDVDFITYFHDHYLPEARLRKKECTIKSECQHVRNWLGPRVGGKPMRDITPADLESVKCAILEAGRAPRTAQLSLSVFRLVWNHARKRGLLEKESPTYAVSVGKIKNARTRFLSNQEANKLLDATKKRDPMAWELTLAALYTGARLGELVSLKWANVDLENEQLALLHTKTGEVRNLKIARPLLDMLKSKPQGQPREHVFVNQIGEPWTETPWAFRQAVDDIGLNEGHDDRRDRIVFHSLRHTAASLMLGAGVDPRTIQTIFGWSTLQMLERYTHALDENKSKAAMALENALAPRNAKIIQLYREKPAS
ncbi:MAG: tyrosine-type recombinase/integrase [Desulfovibrionaceae bacterium]